MDMVLHSTDENRRAIELFGYATEIRMERIARGFVAQERPPLFSGENQMNVNGGKGLRHSERMMNRDAIRQSQRDCVFQPKVGALAYLGCGLEVGNNANGVMAVDPNHVDKHVANDKRFSYPVVMALADAYLSQVKNLSQILQAIRQAQPPERFTHKFLEGLDFKSTNDRGIIGVLKALGFIDESGTPKQPYFDYLDDERHKGVLAEGIRRAYADLFKLNNKANEKDAAWVKNKLKMLTQGTKSDAVLAKMTATFIAICKEADFSIPAVAPKEVKTETSVEAPPPAVTAQELPTGH